MTTTPVSKSKLKCKVNGRPGVKKDQHVAFSTPDKSTDLDNDYSPVYFPLTQESNEEIDVLWDWHSPQSTHRKRRKQKRLIPAQSPKFPLKRQPSNTQTQNFEQLRNELKALQEELAAPDDESVLCVSPQQEIKFEDDFGFESQPHCDEFNDLFNDSLDEQLILCSQQIENEIQNSPPKTCDNINDIIKKYSEKSITNETSFFNSTFDVEIKNTPKFQFKRTMSSDVAKTTQKNIIETASGKLELHRTKSFEMSGHIQNTQSELPKNIMEEIERKRLEAKAKLEAKKKNAIKSPNKCSPEEIEKKRLEALAKLENKRLQDIVEKKRQEALKKLQANRMKNASQVKSTLTTRL